MEYMETQGQTAQTRVMDQPPEIITTKDLAYLKDAMSWELTAMKKCYHFARECSDAEVRNILERAGKMHQKHYEILLKHVDVKKSIS
ncbi:hypothetical protein H0A61_02076 [Koleobacter methoxysyntrophicus]|uniref:Uncharacterized protein n=1 Tax=Koleobacter methoxysyntrophicus TaxID=2751313 RepID=A0A8A0RQM0_9FIRM|nr:hypothetical protein [Koleobacter methoxysyntrophicus]MDK2901758.1 hypothetical protein [Thermosediminibacterales bacterium]QSQ09697.1 hypothetical protein H0A61_02076 [Koleobacter methoxysyntrophicus]